MRAISAVGEKQRRPPSNVAGDRHGTGAGARAAPASLAAAPGNRLLRDGLSANEAAGNHMQADSANHARELRFVRSVHLLRTLGLGLGVLCVASVLRLHEESLGW